MDYFFFFALTLFLLGWLWGMVETPTRNQRSARESVESQYWHSLNITVSMSFSLKSQEIFQSRRVSVSTSKKFLSPSESWSRLPTYIILLSLSLVIPKLSKSRCEPLLHVSLIYNPTWYNWYRNLKYSTGIFTYLPVGCPKKTKKLKAENVPLSCGYMDQVVKKSLKDCIVLINI